jgi:type II secretion system protein H
LRAVSNTVSDCRPRRLGSRRYSRFGNLRYGFSARGAGFTLIELILVLALLAIVLGVASPSLSRFFHGRKLDEEAQRFLALTRYGQSRAISEGVPMVLWIDTDERLYGLTAETTYTGDDRKAVEFELNDSVILELELPVDGDLTTPWQQTELVSGNMPAIRFTPDGFVSETSPERIVFIQETDVDESIITVGLSRHRLRYEIQTNLLQSASR